MKKQAAIDKAKRLAENDDFVNEYFVIYDPDYETFVVANEWDIGSFYDESEIQFCTADY